VLSCLFVLSVCNVDVLWPGQTIGWIKMKLGMQLGLSSGHIVLDGDAVLPKGAQLPIFGPYLLWPNGRMNQDTTW